jgi:hypothetical protein
MLYVLILKKDGSYIHGIRGDMIICKTLDNGETVYLRSLKVSDNPKPFTYNEAKRLVKKITSTTTMAGRKCQPTTSYDEIIVQRYIHLDEISARVFA